MGAALATAAACGQLWVPAARAESSCSTGASASLSRGNAPGDTAAAPLHSGQVTPDGSATPPPTGRKKMNSFVREAAERVGPAVARLDIERGLHSPRHVTAPLLRGMFGDASPAPQKRERGQGSGFVYDGEAGLIVTNAHVVKGSVGVKVTFIDGRTLEGSVLGADDVTDIALVKVDSQATGPLPTAPLGNSATLEIGDWVIAVGNPFGLDNTVTLGILSNLQRTSAEVGIPDKRLDFLQTDCAINPGNSGGPLVNEYGEVIGISTAIRADAEGIGFAIPINIAKAVCARLAEGSAVRHAYLGVQMVTNPPGASSGPDALQPGSDRLRGSSGGVMTPGLGVKIVRVLPSSPAEAAGLQAGDIVVSIEGEEVRTARQLQAVVEQSTIGQRLSLEILRGGVRHTVQALTGDMAGRRAGDSSGERGAYKQLS